MLNAFDLKCSFSKLAREIRGKQLCDEFACTTMTCTVISIRAELIAWYQRRGFRSTGEFKPFPYGDARFGLPKRDDLRFEVFAKAVL